MSRAEIVSAHTASARLERARAFLRALPASSPALIVAPSLSAAGQLVAATLAEGEVRFGWYRRTLDVLAHELATRALAARGFVVVRGLGMEALCARVAHELVTERALTRYRDVAERPGFVRALAKTIDDLRMGGVAPAALRDHDADLAQLLAGYERTLGDGALVDRAGLYALAGEALAKASSPPVAGPLLVLDACVTHAREAEFLAALVQRSAPALLTLVHGDERTRALLTRLVPDAAHTVLAPALNTDLERVSAGLFAAVPADLPAPRERGRVELLSSPGESRESVELVRRVLELASTGIPFDRMAIALRATSTYRAVLEEALARAGIPAHFADGVERPSPEGRALLALLECAREGLSARAFAEYLSLGVMPKEDALPEGEEPLRSPRRWEHLLVDAAVMGGRARWERRLKGLAQALTREAEALEADDPRRTTLARDADALMELLRFALPLLDALETLPEGGTWSEWLSALEALARRALRAPEHVCEVLAELLPLGPMGPVSLSDVTRLLGRRLPTLLVRSEGPVGGKLFVGAIDDVLGHAFDVVLVPGLAEKLFPPRVLEDPLLPDAVRRAVSPDLSCSDDGVVRERLFLRIAVGAARERLVVSFPRFDVVHARPRVPSFYGLELLRAIDGTLPPFDELSRRAHPGAAARMGFPAPERAEQAIDDAEYDLAMLDLLLRADPEAQRGAAVFLLRANAHLARALRFRARRWMLPKFNPADGFVASREETRALAARYALSERAYAPSSLAHMAACPYRFFLQAIMRVASRVEVTSQDELDARQRGIFFHAVQRAVLTELRARKLLPLAFERLDEARTLLHERFEALAEEAREEYAPAIEGVFRDALASTRADLDEWLRRLSEERTFVPAYFELGFGVSRAPELDPASTGEEVLLENGMRQRGVIDLVELALRPAEQRVLRATDFKTGAVPDKLSQAITGGGRMLQPLLYALALERLFPGARVHGGRLYFCTAEAGFVSHEVPLNEHTRLVARDLSQSINDMITRAFLPAAPAPKECEHCAYQAVCGPYEELRVAQFKRKDMERLAPLYHLRQLP